MVLILDGGHIYQGILTHLKTIFVYFQLFFSLHDHAISVVYCTRFRLSPTNWSVAYVCVTLYHMIGWYPSWCIHINPDVCAGFSVDFYIRNVGTQHAGSLPSFTVIAFPSSVRHFTHAVRSLFLTDNSWVTLPTEYASRLLTQITLQARYRDSQGFIVVAQFSSKATAPCPRHNSNSITHNTFCCLL
jgi:hypothetical protein